MGENFPNWLTKSMIKGIRSFNIDSYLLALEGWRRGLKLTWYYDTPQETDIKLIGFNSIGKIYSLESKEGKKHYFYRSRGDRVSNKAVDIASNKDETKRILINNGVNVPIGKDFNKSNSKTEIIEQSQKIGFPLAIKPTQGSLGNGVFTDVNREEDLGYAIDYIRNELEYNDVLIEKHIEGEEYRLYVVGKELVACTLKEAPNVVGNGKNSIKDLIEQKNELRKENPHLSRKLIKMNEQLKKQLGKFNYSLDTVLENNEKVYLNTVANTSVGGESTNLEMSQIPVKVKEEAIKAIASFPNLGHAGLDIIVKEDQAYVIEVNTTASFLQHIFPLKGEPINVCSKIIDYYFPETKDCLANEKIYFNYKKVSEILKDRLSQSVEITTLEAKVEPMVKRYIISGKVQGVGFREYTRREASRYQINGYVKNLKNGNVVVIAWTTNKENLLKFEKKLWKGSKKSSVEQIKELNWDKQLNVGFEIRKSKD
ncbi:acylphosphatase [Alkalibacillus haloalkaliphilus]|uniref:acylphosphatase n=1 Tax=Alkalibacillus haloalkaliphilus TaxID=94136 RepID=UPI00293546DE|nr:acylphosphatase [Alkalibacillus haloalkaliphilus]MDV2583319.1 acylphosphatase [Alkalibacillus haloalkaliphilus]